jgi:2-polyprenyl-3-methyl-5-hydroxy-6-metoxy-1,4-benzoquinol methylase
MPTDRTQEFFHSYANNFDAIYSNQNGLINGFINRVFRRSMKMRYMRTVEGCRPIEGKTVLDVGCGPGHYSITLAQRGAAKVVGIDFAGGMLELAAQHARAAGVSDRCDFSVADFNTYAAPEPFDYVIVMGFMDYVAEPRKVIEKVLSLTRGKAFFSFPVDSGFLAWQRSLRYRSRCDLFLYSQQRIRDIFAGIPGIEVMIEPCARDYFVTMSVAKAATSPEPARAAS